MYKQIQQQNTTQYWVIALFALVLRSAQYYDNALIIIIYHHCDIYVQIDTATEHNTVLGYCTFCVSPSLSAIA